MLLFLIAVWLQVTDVAITEFEARDFCRSQVMMSTALKTCGDLISVGLQASVDLCAEDLQVGGPEWNL